MTAKALGISPGDRQPQNALPHMSSIPRPVTKITALLHRNFALREARILPNLQDYSRIRTPFLVPPFPFLLSSSRASLLNFPRRSYADHKKLTYLDRQPFVIQERLL